MSGWLPGEGIPAPGSLAARDESVALELHENRLEKLPRHGVAGGQIGNQHGLVAGVVGQQQ